MSQPLQVFAFYATPDLTEQVVEAQVDGLVVDWEYGDKERRQGLYNTQINRHGSAELAQARSMFSGTILCRINGGNELSLDEAARAIDLGASEIIVPMITHEAQVERLLQAVNGQVGVGLMIETEEALTRAKQLGQLPLSRVYVGLNDLAIARGSRNLFLPMVDGTLEAIRPHFAMPFGVAGLTHPALGQPIPSQLLLHELIRMQCHFTFLRRSFYRDLSQYPATEIIQAIRLATSQKHAEPKTAWQAFRSQVEELSIPLL